MELDQWADINEYLLENIVQHIDSLTDYIRFRISCKSWYEQLPKYSQYIKTPLLLLPFDDESNSLRPLYHSEEKKVIYRLSLPQTKDTLFRGCSHGWLVTVRLDDTIPILNPITKVQIHLPSISILPTIVKYEPDNYDQEYWYLDRDNDIFAMEKWRIQSIFVWKIILSSAPDDGQDFMAIAIYGDASNLCYCRLGDTKWTQMTFNSNVRFRDAIFHEGKIYAVNSYGWIFEYDMKTTLGGLSRKPSCDLENFDYFYKYLVQSSDGLLLVVKDMDDFLEDDGDGDVLNYGADDFHVFKLDEYENKWSRVENLKDHASLLDID